MRRITQTLTIRHRVEGEPDRYGNPTLTWVDEAWPVYGVAPRGGQAFSIGVLSASAVDHLPWCSLWFTGKWCSCGADIAGFPIFEGA